MKSWDEIEHRRQLLKCDYNHQKNVEDTLAIYLTEDQLDDLLSNRISRMQPVIDHIRDTYLIKR